MKATENKLIRFLEGHDKNFVIPVYQRNYDWNKENCKQLFEDLMDVINNQRKSHFFGSIVYLYNDETEENGQEFIIIDGQQRITTLTLLMIALVHEQEETGKDNNLDINLIKNEYLVGKYNNKEKIKLKPVKDDAAALIALFSKNEKKYINSNIIVNYKYFRNLLKECKLSYNEIFTAIKRLDIVDIRLKSSEDDPQLIFESLNSTGLDLSEADKVRNFILMRLNSDKQNDYYEKYWNNIEKLTDYNVSNFLRDYLTYKERRVPNINKVYFVFKEYVQKNADISIEDVLKELLTFSEYYHIIIHSNHPNKKIREILINLNKLDMTVAYPFLLEVLSDYYREKIISDDNLCELLLTIESFLVRRLACDVPTNALNKLFMTLGRDIKYFSDYKEKYTEVLKYIFSQRRGSQRFPNDEEVKEKMLLKDFYNMNAKNNMHVFESLENYENREKIDLQKLLADKEVTIEHIMPQTLSRVWQEELGDNYEQIHSVYLHTIGNLTLSAYNSEMGNKAFSEKKTINGGFNQSKLYLNEFVKQQAKWDDKAIISRANILIAKALRIWRSCKTNYENVRDIENTYSLTDDVNFTGEKIKYFIVLGQKINAEYWVNFFQQICIILYDLESTKFRNLLEDSELNKKSILISKDENKLREPLKISEDIYLEGNLSTEYILYITRIILKKLDIDLDEVNICLRENKIE
jgi:uncharacterized protein with ParB-like and HNH nuclease domain